MAKHRPNEPETDPTPVGVPDAPEKRVMTLQEARGAFLPMLQGWRGMVRMGEAIDAALTAEAHATAAERRVAEADTALAALAGARQSADEGLELARQGLVGVQDATRLAKEELATVKRRITEAKAEEVKRGIDVKKAWDAERAAAEKEINVTQVKLDKIRGELAAVVKQHAA